MTGRRKLLLVACGSVPTLALVGLVSRRDGPTPEVRCQLLALAAEAIIGLPIERGHYEAYFSWRMKRTREAILPYGRVVDAILDHDRRGETRFQDLPLARRAELARQSGPGSSGLGDILAPLRREALALFARTDGWVHAGYEHWPGTPRGFDGIEALPGSRPADWLSQP